MRTRARILLAVILGGALGTLARVGLASAFASMFATSGTAGAQVSDGELGAALTANILGSLLLGVIAGVRWPPERAALRAALGPGFCGGFTTFSLIALALAGASGASPWALVAAVAGTIGGVLACAAGLALGRRLSPEPAA